MEGFKMTIADITGKKGVGMFKEFNFHTWVVVRSVKIVSKANNIKKDRIIHKGYVFIEKNEVLLTSRYFSDFDECLNYTRDRAEEWRDLAV